MRTFILGFLIWGIFTVFARWYFVCEMRNLCGQEEPPPISRAMTLNLTDGDSIILEGYEQFAFDSASPEPILTENNREFIAEAVKYLNTNSDKHITLTGRYLSNEIDTTRAAFGMYENLGIARAAIVESLLTSAGIDPKRIKIDHELARGNYIKEYISFNLFDPELAEYTPLEYSFEDMTFSDANFEHDKAIFTPGPQFVFYADSVISVLQSNPDLNLLIIGHTDSTGTEEYNLDLGARRAVAAMEYFVNKNVDEKQISTESMGETDPTAPNTNPDGTDNEEGRQKNRRVNFKIQPVPEDS